ncbi:MAG: 3-hydroxyacyl-CoA dehydrogenase NAD-binding domain-containing protein [Verrucomicrobiota bacterium]
MNTLTNTIRKPARRMTPRRKLRPPAILLERTPHIRRTITADGICVLTFDAPDSTANIFTGDTLFELGRHLEWVEKQNHHTVRALIIESAKKKIFIAGADINCLHDASPSQLDEFLALGQRVFNRLANLSIPTVAAIHGACMGGGFELALACDYRVASFDKSTKLALPEVHLGIIPGWGGTTRLPRLIGLKKALPLLLTGKKLSPSHAKHLGIVDAVAHRENLHNAARDFIKHGKPSHKKHFPLLHSRIGVRVIARATRARLLNRTRGHYPAPLSVLNVATRGIHRSLERSLELERDAVRKLAQSPVTRHLIRTFLLQQKAKKLTCPTTTTNKPAASVPPVKRTAVIGAGTMGAGIAHWLATKNLPVTLEDVSPEKIAAGLHTVDKRFTEAVGRRILTPAEATRQRDLIFPADNPGPLTHADLVIEAATENLPLKKTIFQNLEKRTRANTILATNTSALPVGHLASAGFHPERVIGIHFFNPVHRMQLVEVVVPKTTHPAVTQATLSFVQSLGKLPVIVSDTPGFLVNRLLMPYLLEAVHAHREGIPATLIDNTMLDFGMPMGPLRLLDEIGLDVALHVAKTLATSFPGRMPIPPGIEEQVARGRLGRKSGSGFYSYHRKSTPEAYLPTHTPERHHDDPVPLAQRLVFPLLNEAARALDEKVVASPDDLDFAMIMGTGFAPFRGGPLRYADVLGPATIVSALEKLQSVHGDRFTPAPRLLEMLPNNLTFHIHQS